MYALQAEKDLEGPDNLEVSLEAYLGLMKSSWIVENVINKWLAENSPPEEIKRNIDTLVAVSNVIRVSSHHI